MSEDIDQCGVPTEMDRKGLLERFRAAPSLHPHWIGREFESWLKTNSQRFTRPPYLFKETKKGVTYRFEGVSGRIELYMDSHQFLTGVSGIDIIIEYDVSLDQTKSGRYFCSMCLPKYQRYYNSRASLMAAHCFEPLVKWVNANLRPENTLVICGKPRRSSWVRITDSVAAGKMKDSVRFRYPIILRKANG